MNREKGFYVFVSLGLAIASLGLLVAGLNSQRQVWAASPVQPSAPPGWRAEAQEPTALITVCASCPYTSVQAAINAISPGGMIKVAQGIYTGTGDQVAQILKPLTLQGGYTVTNWNAPNPISYPTILDGEQTRRVVYIGKVAATVEGFHIRNGAASSLGGSGLYVDVGNSIIRNNHIYSNTASAVPQGGGVYLAGGSPVVEGNLIYWNTANGDAAEGGGLYSSGGAPLIQANDIYSNLVSAPSGTGGGGGMYIRTGAARIRRNQIYSNSVDNNSNGGGIAFGQVSQAVMELNTVHHNRSGNRGGGVYASVGFGYSLLIQNNLFYNNWATAGSGIGVRYAENTTIQNNTIYANIGDGFYQYREAAAHAPDIRNNIIVGNTTYGIRFNRATTYTAISYNNVWGNPSGNYRNVPTPTTDISADPMFEAPGADFRPQAGSPCIDAADALNFPLDDYAGYARPFGARADMGAYEFYTGTCFARVNGAGQVYTTVQAAVNVSAHITDVIQVAGTCRGVHTIGGLTQTVYISKPLTLRGGYTVTEWTRPTTIAALDAMGQGRVIYITGVNTVTVDGLVLRHGRAAVGGGLWAQALNPTILNTIFYSNTADYGGGLASTGGKLRFYNNTLAANSAIISGGGVYLAGGQAVISNTIIVSHSAAAGGGVWAAPGVTVSADYNDVWNNVPDDGNIFIGAHSISANPLFANPTMGNFHLVEGSPCVSRGDPRTSLALDIEGDARPLPRQSRWYDIGADESVLYPDVSLTPPQAGRSTRGWSVTYAHLLVNTGVIAQKYNLTASSSQGYTATLAPSATIFLPAGGATTVLATILASNDAISGTWDTSTLTATGAVVFDVITDTTLIELTGTATLAPGLISRTVAAPQAVYTHTLINDYNTAQAFTLAGASAHGYQVTIEPATPIYLEANGDSRIITVTVKIPSGAISGTLDNTHITATGLISGLATADDMTTVGLSGTLALQAAPEKIILPGQPALYAHRLANNYNVTQTLALTYTSSQGYAIAITPGLVITLGPNGDWEQIEVAVATPGDALYGTVDHTVLTLTGAITGLATVSDVTTIGLTGTAILQPAQNRMIQAGQPAVYTHTLINNYNTAQTFELRASSSQGYSITVAPTRTAALAAWGGATVATVTVLAPREAISGTLDTATLYATASADGAVATVRDVTTISLTGASAFEPLERSRAAPPGGQAFYTHTLTNRTNYTWTFDLAYASSQGWPTSVEPGSPVRVGANGGSVVFSVTVTAPLDALSGTINSTAITVTQPGPRPVSLAVQDITIVNCTRPAGATLTYSPDAPRPNNMVDLTVTLAAGSAPITFTWNFGDNTPLLVQDGVMATASTAQHIFTDNGGHTVIVTASNACGVSSAQRVIFIPYSIYLPLALRNQ